MAAPTEIASTITRVITRADQQQALQVRRAELRVVRGPDKGLSVSLPPHGIVVGAGAGSDLVLHDPAVSGRHFELLPLDSDFVLRDLGSKNGTLVGRVRVLEARLEGGEEIWLGSSRLKLKLSDELEEFPLSDHSAFGSLLGRSLAMRQVFAMLERAAPSESNILLEGESGTGKDLAAEAVHMASPRRDKPLLVVDCAAMKAALVESELFGHCKGAFTGAEQERAGTFEAAKGGTVFLDEIGELEPGLQLTLLRVLEKREVKRLGENRHRPVDVRVIAATNRDLAKDVESGRFREDLFYRISVLRLRMPSLREHREDIGLLARAMVQKMAPDRDPLEVVHDQVLAMFLNHDWPGNVRELRNVVERLLLFPDRPQAALAAKHSDGLKLDLDVLGLPFAEAREQVVGSFERAYLAAGLDAAGGVVARAAEAAGMPRQSFYRLIKKHGLVK